MYSPRRKPNSKPDDRSEMEVAQDALSIMKQIEDDTRPRMTYIKFSNGVVVSSTSEEQLKEYESRYAKNGVKVIRRF